MQQERVRDLMDADGSYWMSLREGVTIEMIKKQDPQRQTETSSRQIRQLGCTTQAYNLLK